VDIQVYVDYDWVGDVDRRRSTSIYVFLLFGGAVSWMSKQQAMGVLSTLEIEYMAVAHVCKEAIGLMKLCP
jgi:hypothetical protein